VSAVDDIIKVSYFATAVLFIAGLRSMGSPTTARRGIVWAGVGMAVAAVATFFTPGMHHRPLMLGAVVAGVAIAQWSGRRVPMTGMPQMIALFNGMGGGAAAAIAAVELIKGGAAVAARRPADVAVLAVVGALIGAVSFGGSLIAFAKLQGLVKRVLSFPGQNVADLLVLAIAVAAGVLVVLGETGTIRHVGTPLVGAFIAVAFVFGILMTLPIGGADMPVVISLYNALTGLAVAFEGYVLGNPAMIIAGMVVGAAGTMLTQLMARAMNRSLANVLFSGFGGAAGAGATAVTAGASRPIDAGDAAIMMAYADKVVIAPGYGMAVAQAQHKVWELAQLLLDRGIQVKFAIHPVAGRMPGHMNVLLAEAGVPYDFIYDIDDINPEFATTDVALVIGANDTVNLAARTDPASPIYGMPILDVGKARNVVVIKRGAGAGFAGIENPLFFADNVRMLYRDGQEAAAELIRGIKSL
jgi:H+-translocating NAD(P) transhydrogenase subunit beta